MTLYLETLDGFVVWTGQPIGEGEDAVCHPLHIEQLWSAGALADWGLYVPAEADPVPDGKVITATTVERVGEVVRFVHTLEDAPVYIPETPQLYALATMTIETTPGNEGVSSIVPSAKFAGAFRLDAGVYWVFFSEVQPDATYQVLGFNHAAKVYVSERYEDYFVVNAEIDGAPTDPGSISIQVTRVV